MSLLYATEFHVLRHYCREEKKIGHRSHKNLSFSNIVVVY